MPLAPAAIALAGSLVVRVQVAAVQFGVRMDGWPPWPGRAQPQRPPMVEDVARSRGTHCGRLVLVAFLTAAVAACGNGNGGSTEPDPTSEPVTESDMQDPTLPEPEAQDNVTLREIGSCDDVSGTLGGYLSGFELYDSAVVAGDDRYSCEWRRPAEPDGWELAVILVGHYANTPDFASNDWESAGFTQVDDPRVEPFDGLAVLTEPGTYRAVHVMGRHFDARLQVVALRGQEPDHIPVDDAIGILLALTESGA